MMERGLSVDHTTIYRWVMIYAPKIEKRSRKYIKSTNDSMRVDETYIKVKGKWKYLYRAVDSNGNTLDLMLSSKRDHQAAKRFIKKVLKARHNKQPRVINVDKNSAYPIAVEELRQEGLLSNNCELRPKKYLNNIIEQDHRFLKKLAKYKSYFQYFHTAWRTLRGYGIMNMIRKSQIEMYLKEIFLNKKILFILFSELLSKKSAIHRVFLSIESFCNRTLIPDNELSSLYLEHF